MDLNNLLIYGLLFFQMLLLAIGLLIVAECYRALVKREVPFVRSSKKVWQHVINNLSPDSNKVFYDLGCGDGSLLFLVEEKMKMKVKGYEKGLLPYLLAMFKKCLKKSKAEIKRKDLFKQNYADADYIYLYLLPSVVQKLEPVLLSNIKKGAIVMSNSFSFKTIKPYKIIDVFPNKTLNRKLYFYQIN